MKCSPSKVVPTRHSKTISLQQDNRALDFLNGYEVESVLTP